MFHCCYEACKFTIRNEKLMQIHVKTEHGPNCEYLKLSDGEDTDTRNQKSLKKRGQTKCNNCEAYYNNRSRPVTCICGENLVDRKVKPLLNPVKLGENLYSVRKNKSGYNKRIIVKVDSKICYSPECLESRAHLKELEQFSCEHLEACYEDDSELIASVIEVELSRLEQYIQCEEDLEEVKKVVNDDNKVIVYLVSNVLVLPSFQPVSHECLSGWIHIDIDHMKCSFKRCSARPRYHFHVTAEMLCLHILVCKIVKYERNLKTAPNLDVVSSPQFSKVKTVEIIIENIIRNIPPPVEEDAENEFLQNSTATNWSDFSDQNRILTK